MKGRVRFTIAEVAEIRATLDCQGRLQTGPLLPVETGPPRLGRAPAERSPEGERSGCAGHVVEFGGVSPDLGP